MMLKIRRIYNQNKKMIWKFLAGIVFLIMILQFLNTLAKNKKSDIEYNEQSDFEFNNYSDVVVESNKSALTNKKLSDDHSEYIEIINSFFAYCNNKNIKEAYGLLTEECKELMYPKFEDFKNSYYKEVFNGKKRNVSIENWNGKIYKVEIMEDVLATGNYDEASIKQDYITIDESNSKLNINGYIGTKQINKENSLNDNITIKVEKKDQYMDYEIYTFKVKNNMNNPILLDNLTNIDSMYLEDENKKSYSAYTHELSEGELCINEKETRTVKIKFYNRYSSEKKIKTICFSKIIVDYYSYTLMDDNSKFNNYNSIKIEI